MIFILEHVEYNNPLIKLSKIIFIFFQQFEERIE